MILCILFIGHFLADFTLQTTRLVQKKPSSFKYQVYHALIYAAVFLLAVFPLIKYENAIFPYIIIICSHFFIDWIRTHAERKFHGKTTIFASFIMDQVIHILVLAIVYYAFDLDWGTTKLYGYLRQWPYFKNIVVYSLALVILWDPTAVFVKKLFTYVLGGNSYAQEENDPQVGRIIGKLERLIISALIFNNQFGAVGFALTAKSIARYKQLEDKNFAEKYLVGTLTSVSIAFIVTIVLKQQLI